MPEDYSGEMGKEAANSTALAALGFRVHSGWAALVAVSGPLAPPSILDRRRVELVEPNNRDGIQPYHRAAEMDLKEAEAFINHCSATSEAVAIRGLGSAIEHLKGDGYQLAGCGVLLSSGRPTTDLVATLRSHALIHTAEGQFFREVLMAASRHHGLAVTTVRERELYAHIAEQVGVSQREVQDKVVQVGRAIGPPWTQDQKYAALVACLALAAHSHRAKGPGRPAQSRPARSLPAT